jgi:hypothetical protein
MSIMLKKAALSVALVTATCSFAAAGHAETASPASTPVTATQPNAEVQSQVAPLYADDTVAPAAPAKKVLSGSFGVTIPTKYISRGLILNRDRGIIAQPFAELDFDAYDGKGFINKISPFVGIWSDVISNHQYAGSTNLRSWYEFDWDAGVSIDFLDKWNFNIQYIEFTSPSNAFGTAKNIIPQITYDDTDFWKGKLPFALHPYVAGLIETHGKAGSGAKLGYYLEPGINPSITLAEKSDLPVTLTFPIKVGLGFNNFYGGTNARKNETLGYVSAGAYAAIPLKFMDGALGGAWTLNGGASYYYYGAGTHAFNSAGGFTDRNDVIGSVGLTVKF